MHKVDSAFMHAYHHKNYFVKMTTSAGYLSFRVSLVPRPLSEELSLGTRLVGKMIKGMKNTIIIHQSIHQASETLVC